MERTEKTWILEIILGAILVALVGLWGWTATRVIENGERIIEVKAELQQQIAENRREIAEVKAELGREIAELNAKMDLLISGLNISVAPKESASAGGAATE